MPKFSKSSLKKLETCHQDLQVLFNYVIKERDCTVIFGHRSIELQQELYAQGRTKPGKIVTYLDGIRRLSKHNHNPSLAVDVVPFPIDWTDTFRFAEFGNYVLGVADTLRKYGMIENEITWGGDWKTFKDYPHFQI